MVDRSDWVFGEEPADLADEKLKRYVDHFTGEAERYASLGDVEASKAFADEGAPFVEEAKRRGLL